MLKRYMLLAVATVFFAFQALAGFANAAELDDATRTVALNDGGQTTTLSVQQAKEGQRLFAFACANCHVGGDTKTNPTINLASGSLSGAVPSRDNLEGLVDYMKNPTTYDGAEEISEVHPSTKSTDVFPLMKNLSEDDLVAIAGHILIQPSVIGEQWGGGKTVR
ncbi:MAG: cytochrome c-550 [Acaryochloridaceae cyanobacterium CSU_5_19]|nr:cytochrome c-550 [Acaryochloridaceae cyanobacterium CSU_5_19]